MCGRLRLSVRLFVTTACCVALFIGEVGRPAAPDTHTHTQRHTRGPSVSLSRVHAHIYTLAAHLTRSAKPLPLLPPTEKPGHRHREREITEVVGQSQQRSCNDLLSEVEDGCEMGGGGGGGGVSYLQDRLQGGSNTWDHLEKADGGVRSDWSAPVRPGEALWEWSTARGQGPGVRGQSVAWQGSGGS